MSKIDDIKAAIKSIAQSVTGIGNVYTEIPHITKWDEVFEKFVTNDKLFVFFFSPVTRIVTHRNNNGSVQRIQRKWVFKYAYSYSYSEDSEAVFDNMIELICDAFNTNIDFSHVISGHDPMNTEGTKDFATVAKVLCHYVELSMMTYE